MPTLESGGTGIDVQEAKRTVVLYPEYMTMTTDEKLGRTLHKLPNDASVVVPRITTDVCHQHVGAFAVPSQQLGIHSPQVTTVAVAYHCPQGAKRRQLVGQFHTTDVTCVPHLVTLGKVLYILLIPITMGIRKKTDTLHQQINE